MKLISFDLQADFAFFRKPETNNTINLSYNMIHRPAILGVLGAILGLEGYTQKGKLPKYYEVLRDVKLGIQPLQHDKGNYKKTTVKYSNTVGYANKGTNFLTEEVILVAPSYRIFLLLDEHISEHAQLMSSITSGQSEYIPYLGKNEFTAWWTKESVRDYAFEQKQIADESVSIQSIFVKKTSLRDNTEVPEPDWTSAEDRSDCFMYFERLPKDLDPALMQYELNDFVYSTYRIRNTHALDGMCYLKDYDTYVQLF